VISACQPATRAYGRVARAPAVAVELDGVAVVWATAMPGSSKMGHLSSERLLAAPSTAHAHSMVHAAKVGLASRSSLGRSSFDRDSHTKSGLDGLLAGLRMHAVTGYAAVLVVILAPLSVRLAYGVVKPRVFFSTLFAFGLVMACGMVVLVSVFRAALLRGLGLKAAGVLSLCTTMPVMVLGYLGLSVAQRIVPWFCFLDPEEPTTASYGAFTALADSFPMIAAWAGMFQLPALLRMHEAREREFDTVRREAELLRLKAHLEPHFLLNTMNAIGGLVTEDPAHARELLGTLGELLRDATSIGDEHTVRDEVAWLERYAAIHQARFPGLFSVEWQVEASVNDSKLPALVSQPLLENAISHGALGVSEGKIVVRFARAGGRLVLEIRDNGRGPGPRRSGGKGLAIVERRLELESRGREPSTFELVREGNFTVARVVLAKEGT
jgi:hypothetical protein